MKQLIVFCEGATEQVFCGKVLRQHLFPQGGGFVHTLSTGKKDYHHVHGLSKYATVRTFIWNEIKAKTKNDQKNIYFTTMFDLYGLPSDFPGTDVNVLNRENPTAYVDALEKAFGAEIDYHHFIPHFQLYEYETILFAEPDAFAYSYENRAAEIQQLKTIAASVRTIENINDRRETAPSKRIIKVIPEYAGRKALDGPDIAEYIGIPTIRGKCPHFDGWLTQLESIAWQ